MVWGHRWPQNHINVYGLVTFMSSLRETHQLRWGAKPPPQVMGFPEGGGRLDPQHRVLRTTSQWVGCLTPSYHRVRAAIYFAHARMKSTSGSCHLDHRTRAYPCEPVCSRVWWRLSDRMYLGRLRVPEFLSSSLVFIRFPTVFARLWTGFRVCGRVLRPATNVQDVSAKI